MSLPDWLATHPSALDERMGLEVLEVSPERTVGRLPVEGNTQPFGLWHGGASAVLVETLASFASAVHGAPDRMPVGVDLNVTHHRGVRSGWVTGVATPLHLGSTSTCYEVVVTDDDGRRVATGRLTCRLLRMGPASEAPEAETQPDQNQLDQNQPDETVGGAQ